MPLLVVGGHTRNIGKTSVVAGLISALREYEWTAVKITQYGHGVCSTNGEACGCAVDEHLFAITEERDAAGKGDSSRFLAAGARRSLWVRTKQGMLAEALPDLRRELAGAQNVIIESNSVLKFLRFDLYLTVLDPSVADFKESARIYLDLADAVLLRGPGEEPHWPSVPTKVLAHKPSFRIAPPRYVTDEVVEFVRQRLGGVKVTAR